MGFMQHSRPPHPPCHPNPSVRHTASARVSSFQRAAHGRPCRPCRRHSARSSASDSAARHAGLVSHPARDDLWQPSVPPPRVAVRWSAPRSPRHPARYRSSGPRQCSLHSHYNIIRSEVVAKWAARTYRAARRRDPRHPLRLRHRRPHLGPHHARRRCRPCRRKAVVEMTAGERIQSRVACAVPRAGLEATNQGEVSPSGVVFLHGESEYYVTAAHQKKGHK